MSERQTLSFVIMDAPFESARTMTALRLIQAAIDRRHDVNVFAYEGAVSLAFARQAAHPNAIHGRDAVEEDHPLPRIWIEQLLHHARGRGVKLTWMNCGLCVDERGANEAIPGVTRGSPADLWRMAQESTNTLVIGTR